MNKIEWINNKEFNITKYIFNTYSIKDENMGFGYFCFKYNKEKDCKEILNYIEKESDNIIILDNKYIENDFDYIFNLYRNKLNIFVYHNIKNKEIELNFDYIINLGDNLKLKYAGNFIYIIFKNKDNEYIKIHKGLFHTDNIICERYINDFYRLIEYSNNIICVYFKELLKENLNKNNHNYKIKKDELDRFFKELEKFFVEEEKT